MRYTLLGCPPRPVPRVLADAPEVRALELPQRERLAGLDEDQAAAFRRWLEERRRR